MNNIVNILIPFYNNEATLRETLSSVQVQTSGNWKVILIDDGSTDSSGSIAEIFIQNNPGKAIIIKSATPQSGPAIGRNAGLRHADGLYVMCLDADDSLTPFCIEQRLSIMQQHPELHWAVFNQYKCSPGETLPYKIFNKPVKTREAAIEIFLKMDVAWQTMAPIWRTESLCRLGFDETLYPSEDPDLHLRALLDSGLNIKICSDLPADCYYNIANKTGDKLMLFYRQSILSKFKFLKKTIRYLPNVVSGKTLEAYQRFLCKGFFNFLNTFLLARLNNYDNEIKEMTELLKNAKVLGLKDILKIKAITGIFTTKSPIVSALKIRGLVHKLFLAEN